MSRKLSFVLTIAALIALPLGCTQSTEVADATPAHAEGDDHAGHDHAGHDHAEGEEHEGEEHADHEGGGHVHVHGAWWCDEHGVPEAECSMCSAKVAKEFKAKGDWCDQHDRARSQCFLCDPSLKDKFAAQYRAKEGKEPPAPDGQQEEKGDKK